MTIDRETGLPRRSAAGPEGKANPEGKPPVRLLFVGGFLNAGKTRLIRKLVGHFEGMGVKAACITNDEGSELVDTRALRGWGIPTEAVEGGCYAQRFPQLLAAIETLRGREKPDIIIAEVAGSSARMTEKLGENQAILAAENITVGPITTLIEGTAAARLFKMAGAGSLSEATRRLLGNQLEEAEAIGVTKVDTLAAGMAGKLRAEAEKAFPKKKVFEFSVESGQGMAEWADYLRSASHAGTGPATGALENGAALGWLNGAVRISAVHEFDGDELVVSVVDAILARLGSLSGDIAHLKVSFSPHPPTGEMTLLSLSANQLAAKVAQGLSEPVESGELLINLRAEASPDALHTAVNQALLDTIEANDRLFARLEHMEHFRARSSSGERKTNF